MGGWTYACLVVGLLLLAAPAGALIPDNVTIVTDTPWLTAGSGDTATITVQVSNSTSGNVSFPGVAINFTVNSTYGSISPARAVTNGEGYATAIFKPATLSGIATITATALYEGLDEPLTGSVDQQIDHAAPYSVANLWYASEVTAGETTPITVRMVDRYGNAVDNRSATETVSFMVGSPTGNATFIGGTDEISVPVDAAGNATALLQVDTVAGEHLVFIQPPAPVRSDYISITGVADGVPSSIILIADPASGSVPADGEKVVELTYTLVDGYGNLVASQGLWVNASIQRGDRPAEQESALLYSNRYGQVMITYGPEDSVGTVTITATAAANESVSVSQVVEFTSTDPVNMLLSASPQSMPSRDVNPDVVSELRAKVMDVKGNPVGDQTVTFEIVTGSVDVGEYNQTEAPYLAEGLNMTSAETNADGYAIVEFHPGAFTIDEDAEGWSETATGTATVRATWNCTARDIELTWKNYPYLSVETAVSPETVAVNETVNVTIRLKGDGWALQPDPIDVVLVIDRSGSMSGTDVSPTRMAAAKAAANDFVDQMNFTRDRVALVSFAFDATLDQGLTSDPDEIEGAINGLSAEGATNMRMAYYTAIKYLKENGRSNAVKAVILMGDGNWNYHGSPLAKGIGYADNNRYLTRDWYYSYGAPLSGYCWSGSSYNFSSEKYEWYHDLPAPKGDANVLRSPGKGCWYDTVEKKWVYNYNPDSLTCDNGQFTNQNLSVYANSGDETDRVKIYSIGFASALDSDVEEDLGVLSEATGGEYVWAGNEDELRNVYTTIAGALKTEASVDTELDVVFENVEVNGNLTTGTSVFDYVYEYGVSTTIESWIDNETGSYEVINFTTINQTSDWNADQNLSFDIGTVRLGQTWETTFRLKVLTDGNINIFGPGSEITFNDGADSLELPDTFITVIPDLNNTGFTSRWLAVNLTDPIPPPGQDAFYDTVPLNWTVTYNGTRDIDEALAYSNDNGRSWTVFWTKTVNRTAEPGETLAGETLMDVGSLPAGNYLIRAIASALDAPEAVDKTSVAVPVGNASGTYIKIG
jgi:Mg-chelatase subunit ChlD|nr:VWA domain-containing protein [Methanoculleus marisnigri]